MKKLVLISVLALAGMVSGSAYAAGGNGLNAVGEIEAQLEILNGCASNAADVVLLAAKTGVTISDTFIASKMDNNCKSMATFTATNLGVVTIVTKDTNTLAAMRGQTFHVGMIFDYDPAATILTTHTFAVTKYVTTYEAGAVNLTNLSIGGSSLNLLTKLTILNAVS